MIVTTTLGENMNKLCLRCGTTWLSRIEGRPKQCPTCKSRVWDKESVRVPMGSRVVLTQQILRDLFTYNPLGWLEWKTGARKGKRVGYTHVEDGYRRVMIRGCTYLEHRLIYLYHHGELPENLTDHKDRERINNKVGNLRDADFQRNNRNRRARPESISGVPGVTFCKRTNKWAVTIVVDYKSIFLKRWSNLFLAVKARYEAEQKYGWDEGSPAFLWLRSAGYFDSAECSNADSRLELLRGRKWIVEQKLVKLNGELSLILEETDKINREREYGVRERFSGDDRNHI